MFRRILVPVDLTQKAMAATDVAFDLARPAKAEVTLLHVIETVEHLTFDDMKDLYKRLEASARKGLRELSERFEAEGIKVDRLVTYGHRTQAIVETAIANQADLIVLASHRIDPDRPGQGWSSISYGVAIMAPCHVLLIK
ncbi:MAG TPA: universal stress protein [Terriglobia bacterium]|nr:universal stress protein [Terriglobia bacterium]